MDIENATRAQPFVVSKNGHNVQGSQLMRSCTFSKTRSHTMRCGPSHTTTCTCHFEADAPRRWIPMLTLIVVEHQSLQPNKPVDWTSFCQCQLMK